MVDDHPLIRSAMRDVVKEVKGDATVLEASSYSQSMDVIAEHPDLELILLDLNLPDRDGFSVLTEFGERIRPRGISDKVQELLLLRRNGSLPDLLPPPSAPRCAGPPSPAGLRNNPKRPLSIDTPEHLRQFIDVRRKAIRMFQFAPEIRASLPPIGISTTI